MDRSKGTAPKLEAKSGEEKFRLKTIWRATRYGDEFDPKAMFWRLVVLILYLLVMVFLSEKFGWFGHGDEDDLVPRSGYSEIRE
ncbi:MAG: hypothetical protein HY204_01795 [Nitrospirae bacterium]|nr:hypothetical protein [Nitrospirota bacterium]